VTTIAVRILTPELMRPSLDPRLQQRHGSASPSTTYRTSAANSAAIRPNQGSPVITVR
jgi:hypothetical protein